MADDILVAVEKYFDGKSEKFDFIGINKEIAEKIKARAPKRKPVIEIDEPEGVSSSGPNLNQNLLKKII